MTLLASTWLGLAVLLCTFAFFAKRRIIGLSLPIAVALAALAVYVPTGSPRFTTPPPGDYKVVGADIVPNVGIWVLLKDGSNPPVYFLLPYSNSQADALQNAMDGEGGAKAQVGQDGGVRYGGAAPVTGSDAKTPETPSLSIP